MLLRHQPPKTPIRGSQWSRCAVCGLILLAVGCMSEGETRKNSSLKATKNVQSSAPELGARNQSMLALYSAEIEAAADRIILESPSLRAQRQALVWKSEAIPVLQTSMLNTDPVIAVLDTWAFIFQMTTYMERPAVKEKVGESYPVVAETLGNMQAEMEKLVRVAAPTADVADIRQRVSAWAEAHPIQASLLGRHSVDPDVIRKLGPSELGIRSSLKTFAEGLGDLTARLDSYNVYLPKQARWQGELLLSDFTHDPQIGAALSNLALLSSSVEKASRNIEQLPEVVEQTRGALNAEIESQRLSAQNFFREERLTTLYALHQERIAAIDAMHNERLATTAEIREERRVALESLRGQEEAVMNEVEALSKKTIQDVDARSRRLINYFFVCALELILVILLLCSVLIWAVRRFVIRPQSRSGESLGHASAHGSNQ